MDARDKPGHDEPGRHPSPPHQLIRKIGDRLAVDGGVIPLAHRLEIRRALAIGRAHLEAVGVQQIGGGGEHVGDAVAQIDAAVAVEIDAVFDIEDGRNCVWPISPA